ncbi:ubiquitin-protein transferase activating protein [Aphanomyces cochlioides]|nr:ubiquitin-protein transferase activating protein [Aphanomyces cochlioides]
MASVRRRCHATTDRFIPSRAAMNVDLCQYMLSSSSSSYVPDSSFNMPSHRDLLFNTLVAHADDDSRLLRFRPRDRQPHPSIAPPPSTGHTTNRWKRRHVSPTRVLEAPDLRDDYYLNLLAWGPTLLAVALDKLVYLYNVDTGSVSALNTLTSGEEYVTSVTWLSDRSLAVGTSDAHIQIWDVATSTKVRMLQPHEDRIGALAWSAGQGVLSSGSKDAKIMLHDMKTPQGQVATLRGHSQEVCGLAWSPDGKTLASGGNDNRLSLWDGPMSHAPRTTLMQHSAAVKALAWCPWERHLLASGGGTADRCIKIWQSHSGVLQQSVQTGSQVCGLVWSPKGKELLSSHGFSQNQLCLWSYPRMSRLREFTGHSARVLHISLSPDGQSVVSAAADETLRFWNVFSSAKSPVQPRLGTQLTTLGSIR